MAIYNLLAYADNGIYNTIKQEYYTEQLSNKFDQHVNDIIYDYKKNTNYFKKLGANNGVYVESQAQEITNRVMILYSHDIDDFVNKILSNTILYNEIQKNYDEYINQGSSIVSKELNNDFKKKYLIVII